MDQGMDMPPGHREASQHGPQHHDVTDDDRHAGPLNSDFELNQSLDTAHADHQPWTGRPAIVPHPALEFRTPALSAFFGDGPTQASSKRMSRIPPGYHSAVQSASPAGPQIVYLCLYKPAKLRACRSRTSDQAQITTGSWVR